MQKNNLRPETLLCEIPIEIHNSVLVDHLLEDIQDELTTRSRLTTVCPRVVDPHSTTHLSRSRGTLESRLSLATNAYLSRSLKYISDGVDELLQHQDTLIKYEREAFQQRQYQELASQRRRDNDVQQKKPDEPSRLESNLVIRQLFSHCDDANQYAGQSFAKFYLASALQKQ